MPEECAMATKTASSTTATVSRSTPAKMPTVVHDHVLVLLVTTGGVLCCARTGADATGIGCMYIGAGAGDAAMAAAVARPAAATSSRISCRAVSASITRTVRDGALCGEDAVATCCGAAANVGCA